MRANIVQQTKFAGLRPEQHVVLPELLHGFYLAGTQFMRPCDLKPALAIERDRVARLLDSGTHEAFGISRPGPAIQWSGEIRRCRRQAGARAYVHTLWAKVRPTAPPARKGRERGVNARRALFRDWGGRDRAPPTRSVTQACSAPATAAGKRPCSANHR